MVRWAPALLLLAFAALPGCSGQTTPASPSSLTAPSVSSAAVTATDLRSGTGQAAVNGMMVGVFYTGWLYDPSATDQKGAMFATNVPSGFTFPFFLGDGQASRGWDVGIVGMRVGGLRRLVVPPELGYGGRPSLPTWIPPNSTLVYEIELDDAWWEDY
jgi:FKBP-type peptidyl-prolyl cis-trans isomerase FkpA